MLGARRTEKETCVTYFFSQKKRKGRAVGKSFTGFNFDGRSAISGVAAKGVSCWATGKRTYGWLTLGGL
jgi:hypothetical protein